MPNMSYCKFQNTLDDLKACEQSLWDVLSEDEHNARRRLIQICQRIADEMEKENLDELPHEVWEDDEEESEDEE